MTEDLPQRPINPYGETKLMFEKMLLWYRQIHELEFVAFRYFNAAGASENFGEHHRIETHLIPNVLKVALGQANNARFTERITPLPTALASAITSTSPILRRRTFWPVPGKTGFFNLGNGDGYSVKQVIETCEKITGTRIPAMEKPAARATAALVAAADKASNELGWKPKFPKLEDIVATAWAW